MVVSLFTFCFISCSILSLLETKAKLLLGNGTVPEEEPEAVTGSVHQLLLLSSVLQLHLLRWKGLHLLHMN